MKTNLKLAVLCSIACMAFPAQSQFWFGITPGLNINGANIGFRSKNFAPFIGIQALGMKSTFQENGQRYDSDLGQVVYYEDKFDVKLTAIIPNIGIKYFFGKSETIRPYAIGSWSKVLLSGKITDSNDPKANEDFQKAIKGTHIWGLNFGAGAEYFMNEKFSLGAEFGLRTMHGSNETERTVEVYDPNISDYISTRRINKESLSLTPTYTRFSVNFYFTR